MKTFTKLSSIAILVSLVTGCGTVYKIDQASKRSIDALPLHESLTVDSTINHDADYERKTRVEKCIALNETIRRIPNGLTLIGLYLERDVMCFGLSYCQVNPDNNMCKSNRRNF